jgi:hypothetical protein
LLTTEEFSPFARGLRATSSASDSRRNAARPAMVYSGRG